MAVGRITQEWDQASLISSLLANIHRDPESKEHPDPYCPSEVHPFRTAEDYRPKTPEGSKPDLSALKGMIERSQSRVG